MKYINDLQEIINHHKPLKQKYVAIEELSELQKEISKDLRGNLNLAHLVEEIADVRIMLDQLEMIYHITSEEISWAMEEKVERELHRIEIEKEKQRQ